MNINLQVGDWVIYINEFFKTKRHNKIYKIQDREETNILLSDDTALSQSDWRVLHKITSINQLIPFKVDCGDVETGKKVQNILFDLGYIWSKNRKYVLNVRYLFVNEYHTITWDCEVVFNQHEYQKIPVELLFWLGEQNKNNNINDLRYLSQIEHTPIDINIEQILVEIENTFEVDIPSWDIPVGTYFTGSVDFNNWPDKYFLRTNSGLACLDNPKHSWFDSYPIIKDYKEIKNINISYTDESGKNVVVK
jgi:hypothetical protein